MGVYMTYLIDLYLFYFLISDSISCHLYMWDQVHES